MSMQTILLLIVVGIASGVLAGMVGVGGGIIIVPALVYFLGFTQKQAQGTSLAILLLPIGILAVMNYYKDPEVNLDIKVILVIVAGFLLGSFFGSKLALALPNATVKKLFAVFIIIMGLKMLFFDKDKTKEEKKVAVIDSSEI